MPKLRLDFWHKDFYTKTAFGRTLSGRNKAGQIVGVVKDTALSAVPFIGKPLQEATGRIVDELEAREIGKEVHELNLAPRTQLIIRIITLGIIGSLVVSKVIGYDDARQLLQLAGDSNVLGLLV